LIAVIAGFTRVLIPISTGSRRRFYGTIGRAPVAIDLVPVIALFTWFLIPISTDGRRRF
jgi:hypothetical protein